VNGQPGRLVGLPPVVDGHTRVLVLGSFPGVASLAAGQYYGHPRNQFWALLRHVFQAISAPGAFLERNDCSDFDYDRRCQWLLAHGVGVWDVYASCERQGSLDAHIRHAQVNDLAVLRHRCPGLRLVAHNGGESFRHARHTQALGWPVVKLPSSSPANAGWSFERKCAAWREALLPALQPRGGGGCPPLTPGPANVANPPDPPTG
jgi:double-stranded uracil-DNA glycosylase